MILAKNYATVFKFVKVMPKILWPLFFRIRSTFVLVIGERGSEGSVHMGYKGPENHY